MMRQLPGDPRWIDEIPAVQAALRPDAPALAQDDVRWSYAQWEAAVATACEALADEGLRAGDRMMIVGENGLVVATLIHAAARVARLADGGQRAALARARSTRSPPMPSRG
jgi:non-ribosomal peptide synthetase component E (peptide arylation enzyme)